MIASNRSIHKTVTTDPEFLEFLKTQPTLPDPKTVPNPRRIARERAKALAIEEALKLGPRAFGYVRCSDHRQAESGLGMEAQKETIELHYRLYCASKGIAWGGFYVDADESATKVTMLKRPEGYRLHTDLKSGDVIIVAKLDRAFRKLTDGAAMLDTWQKMGVTLICHNPGLDTSTAMGRGMLQVMMALAQMETENLSERILAVNKIKRRQGRPLSGRCRTGWRIVRRLGVPTVIADEDDRKVMKLIVQWRQGGHTFNNIYAFLKKQNIGVRVRDKKSFRGWRWEHWGVRKIQLAYHEMMRIMEQEARLGRAYPPGIDPEIESRAPFGG